MGWSQQLVGSVSLSHEDVESILDAINAGHAIPGCSRSKQSWGWSSECDIAKEPGENVRFSGSWSLSGRTDLPERFAEEAKRRRLQVKLTTRT